MGRLVSLCVLLWALYLVIGTAITLRVTRDILPVCVRISGSMSSRTSGRHSMTFGVTLLFWSLMRHVLGGHMNINLYDALLFDKIVTEAWKHIAQALIPLCRGKPAGTFHLPSSLFPEDGGLPGYTEGNTPLPKDPTCSPPTCTLEL